METSCKWHFPSVCDRSHPSLPASPGTVQVPTLPPAEHLGQDDLDGVMRVQGFRGVSTRLRPAGWSKQCQDWPLPKAWAHQFHPSGWQGCLTCFRRAWLQTSAQRHDPGLQARQQRASGASAQAQCQAPGRSQLHACRMAATRCSASWEDFLPSQPSQISFPPLSCFSFRFSVACQPE